MIDLHRPAVVAGLALLLGGCAASAIPRPANPSASPVITPSPAPRPVQNNMLIGHDAASAVRMFGKPRLDITEGGGRKLQFAGSACTIDVYYYAPKQGAEPLATHVDARAPDGRDANVPGCIAALRR